MFVYGFSREGKGSMPEQYPRAVCRDGCFQRQRGMLNTKCRHGRMRRCDGEMGNARHSVFSGMQEAGLPAQKDPEKKVVKV